MSSGTAISVEDYLGTAYDPDCEYLDGEIVERNMGELDHSGLQGLILAWLLNRRKQLGIHVFPEIRIQTGATRYRVADIAVTLPKPKGQILTEAPFLCIEVLSPEDRASRVENKIDDYLNFGVQYVWIIDPRRKRAWSYTASGKREGTDTLTTLNPPIQLPIQELFADLDDEVGE